MSRQSSHITIINIVALLGFALLGFFTFLGAMFFSKGTIGTSIAIALGAVVISAAILYVAIKCKGAENNFAKWKKIEIAAVIVFWLFSLLPARYVIHAFEVMGQKQELLRAAENDVATVNRIFTDYETYHRNALATTRAGLENALGQPCDPQTTAYLDAAAILSNDAIDSWIGTQRSLLLGTRGTDGFSYATFRQNVDSLSTQWLNKIKNWNILYLASHADEIETITPAVVEELSANSVRGKLPVIEFIDGVYSTTRPGQTLIIEAPSLGFGYAISQFGGTAILSYLLYLVIIVLIFLDYIFAYRSNRLDLHKASEDMGGISLD